MGMGKNLMDLERDFLHPSVCLAVAAVAAGQFILEKYPRRGLAIEAAIFSGFGGGCPIN